MKNEKKAKGKNENRRDAYLAGDVKGRKLKKKDSNKKEGSLVPKLFTGRQTRKEKKEKKKKSLYGWCWKKITCCGLCLPCSELGREPSANLHDPRSYYFWLSWQPHQTNLKKNCTNLKKLLCTMVARHPNKKRTPKPLFLSFFLFLRLPLSLPSFNQPKS